MHGDAKAIYNLGFDGIKLDSCGPSQHLSEWVRGVTCTHTGPPHSPIYSRGTVGSVSVCNPTP